MDLNIFLLSKYQQSTLKKNINKAIKIDIYLKRLFHAFWTEV